MRNNPDDNLRELERRAVASGSHEDIMRFLQAMHRAGKLVDPVYPTYAMESGLGDHLIIQPRSSISVIIKARYGLLGNLEISFDIEFMKLNDIHDAPQHPSIIYLDEDIQAGWLPFRESSSGKLIPTFEIRSAHSDQPISLGNIPLDQMAAMVTELHINIHQWEHEHPKEMALAKTLNAYNEMLKDFKDYHRQLTKLQAYENTAVYSAGQWFKCRAEENQ